MELMHRPEIYDGKATPSSAVEFRFLFPRGLVCPCSKRGTIFTTNCGFKAHRKGSTHNKWLSLLTRDEDSSKLSENSLQEVRLLNIKNTELSNQVSQLTVKLNKACVENDRLRESVHALTLLHESAEEAEAEAEGGDRSISTMLRNLLPWKDTRPNFHYDLD